MRQIVDQGKAIVLVVGPVEVGHQLGGDDVAGLDLLVHAAARADDVEHEDDGDKDRDQAGDQQIDLQAQAHAFTAVPAGGQRRKLPSAAKHANAARVNASIAG